MAKSANYFISGVWKDTFDRITDVMLHTVNDDNSWGMGKKISEFDAINLLKQRKTIKTIVWNYPNWEIKANVIYITRGNNEYLRSDANATTKDNLDNLISMKVIK